MVVLKPITSPRVLKTPGLEKLTMNIIKVAGTKNIVYIANYVLQHYHYVHNCDIEAAAGMPHRH